MSITEDNIQGEPEMNIWPEEGKGGKTYPANVDLE